MRILLTLILVALATACSHPLEIVGEGDILSASGDRDCLLEDYQAGGSNCAENLVTGSYQETYHAQPRPGWKFDHWENYCTQRPDGQCSFDVPASVVKQFSGGSADPLRAIFVQEQVPHATCETSFTADDIYVIDLSPNSQAGGACGMQSGQQAVTDCIETEIRDHFADSPGCLNAFEVFVPGTNQEDGNPQQFRSIVSSTPGHTYLSIQYSYDPTLFEDTIEYDKGVADADKALEQLLFALKDRFDTPQVRVYGHSKGSDPVARLASRSQHADVQFYAFAQPGRTPATYRGTPGYMEKLLDNLVVLTWQNDEVRYYTGGDDGNVFPEIWGFPGYVNEEAGGRTVFPLRIDHHNNYGAEYEKWDFPYCATGNKVAMVGTSECIFKSGVEYLPYFWGDDECTARAYDMMENGATGEEYYIGFSGPRSGNCRDTYPTVTARYTLHYSINIADQDDCKYHMELDLDGRDGGNSRADGSTIKWSSTRDTYNRTKTGTIQVPLHMRLNWKAHMEDVSGKWSKCINYVNAKSEGYIHSFRVSFTHPGTGEYITRKLIGNSEGIEYLWPLKVAGKNNVAWRKITGDWDLHFGIPPSYPADALMIKGVTTDGAKGEFYKYIHLLD